MHHQTASIYTSPGIAGLVGVQPDMTLVGQAADGRDAIQQFRAHRPDVTLMDIQLPGMNGIDALIVIRTEAPQAKVIVLTTYEGDVHILRALKAGAQAYLLKNTLHSDYCTRSEPSMLESGVYRPRSRSKSPPISDQAFARRSRRVAPNRWRNAKQRIADQPTIADESSNH
jgi:DNA-binding NarL/FixJ family response regulator